MKRREPQSHTGDTYVYGFTYAYFLLCNYVICLLTSRGELDQQCRPSTCESGSLNTRVQLLCQKLRNVHLSAVLLGLLSILKFTFKLKG